MRWKLNQNKKYGPNEDERAAIKDAFWDEIADIVENLKGRTIILSDFNGKVGTRVNDIEDVIGRYGENVRKWNNNNRFLHPEQLSSNEFVFPAQRSA